MVARNALPAQWATIPDFARAPQRGDPDAPEPV